MTALTASASPGRDVSPRPVPWRRMIWVTWRQHRLALAGVVAPLVALAVPLWIAGVHLHHVYAAATVCHPASSPVCTNLVNTFNGMDGFLANGIILQAVPALIGAFAGAPVLARELETGTFRYAWTQGFGRWRWALAKLVLLAIVVAAAAGVFSVLLSWYYQPYFATGNQALSLTEMTPFFPGLFDLHGVTFAAWTLAAFAIGALAGMLIRRVVPAMAATLAAYAGLAFAAGGFLRQHYLTPLVTSNLSVPGSAWVMSQWWTKDGRFAFAGWPSDSLFTQLCPGGPFGCGGAWRQAKGGYPRAVRLPARLHAVDQLPAREPVLAIPVDRERLAARAVSGAHRRGRLAGPAPRGLIHPAMLPRRQSHQKSQNGLFTMARAISSTE